MDTGSAYHVVPYIKCVLYILLCLLYMYGYICYYKMYLCTFEYKLSLICQTIFKDANMHLGGYFETQDLLSA